MLSINAAAAIQKPIEWCLRDRGRAANLNPIKRCDVLFMASGCSALVILSNDQIAIQSFILGMTYLPHGDSAARAVRRRRRRAELHPRGATSRLRAISPVGLDPIAR